MNVKTQSEFVDQLVVWIRTNVQAVHVIANGQSALAEKLIEEAYMKAKSRDKQGREGTLLRVVTWDCVSGFTTSADPKMQVASTVNFVNAVREMHKDTSAKGNETARDMLGEDACVIFRDPHFELRNNWASMTSIKEGVKHERFGKSSVGPKDSPKPQMRHLFLLTDAGPLAAELVGYVKEIELPLPTRDEINPIIDRVLRGVPDRVQKSLGAGTPDRRKAIEALVGMNQRDVEDVLYEAVLKAGGNTSNLRHTIEAQKASILKRTETLSYTPANKGGKAGLRGFEELDEWVRIRKLVYSDKAEGLNLDMPKGLALVGPPGTGKSCAAQVIADGFELPLVTFDISAVFGSLVGESERRMRNALAVVTSMEGCVLLIDEVDKALGGADKAGGDSGTTARVFGSLLSWMTAKNDRTFVVFTMNRIANVPPELLRRGRVDEVFFVDLPGPEDRRAILDLHMSRRQVDPKAYSEDSWSDLVEATDQFSGAELESLVIAARLQALSSNPESKAVPTAEQLVGIAKKMVPLSRADEDSIATMRQFAKDRAVPVGRRSATSDQTVRAGRRGRKDAQSNRVIDLDGFSGN